MKFVINAPKYHHRSGGIKVLYIFNDLLNKSGNQSRISIIGSGEKCSPDEIAIYPEIVKRNPLSAAHVVRWCLNVPGFCGGNLTYDSNEIVFYYADTFKSGAEKAAGKNLDGMSLTINYFDKDLFYNDGKPKLWSVLYSYKDNVRIPPPVPCIEATRHEPPDRLEFAKLIRGAKAIYSTYQYTGVLAEAEICGCECYAYIDNEWKRVHPDCSMFKDENLNDEQVKKFLKIVKEAIE